MKRHYDQIVSLVGDNPLPVYLGIKQFGPPGSTCTLVYSDRTHAVADRIRASLPDRKFEMEPLDNPYDPFAVCRVLDVCQGPGAALNYTGGTSVMSAFSVLTWRTHTIDTFYLEGDRGLFHFGNGDTKRLDPDLVDVKHLIALHGLVIKPQEDSVVLEPLVEPGIWHIRPATATLLQDLFRVWSANPSLFAAIFDPHAPGEGLVLDTSEIEWNAHLQLSVEDEPDDHCFSYETDGMEEDELEEYLRIEPGDYDAYEWYCHSRQAVCALLHMAGKTTESDWAGLLAELTPAGDVRSPESDWMKLLEPNVFTDYKKSYQRDVFEYIAGGRWFEDAVRLAICCLPKDRRAPYKFGQIPNAPLVDPDSLLVRPSMTVKNAAFECGLVAATDNRLRYVSTTVAANEDACQGRAFESLHRARQMGGDLATSCVVTMADEESVERIAQCVNAEEALTVFGRSHAAAWILNDNCRSLHRFMTLPSL